MRRLALAFAAVVGLASAAAAQPYDTPEALIEAFYEPYFSGEFSDDEGQFRSQGLQALYDNDAQITPEGEMGALAFDPYIDGQDFELDAFSIEATAIEGDVAAVDVSFTNFNEPRSLTYELVFEDDGWKIDDVVSTNPDNAYRLSEIFAEAAGEVE